MTLPPVAEPFYWSSEHWGHALRCRALDGVAPHLFTTRQLRLSSDADYELVARAVGARLSASLRQVHGRDVVVVRPGSSPPDLQASADALVSIRPDTALVVRAADCVPLLLADTRTTAVAAVHAGWRGTAAGVAAAAVEQLASEFGSRPEDLVAVIGPAIGPCCYEVGSDVVDVFAAAGHARHVIDRWFAAQPAPRGSRLRPKLRLDVPGANRDQLILAGVPPARIHVAGLCTAMHLDVLTSYRAERENAGRLAAVIRARN